MRTFSFFCCCKRNSPWSVHPDIRSPPFYETLRGHELFALPTILPKSRRQKRDPCRIGAAAEGDAGGGRPALKGGAKPQKPGEPGSEEAIVPRGGFLSSARFTGLRGVETR